MRIQVAKSAPSWILAAAVAALFLVPGCGSEDHTNEPPTASLTTAPPNGSETSFRIDLAWNGTDPEGRLDRFEYAIDPPAVFTEEEIAHGGPGIIGEEIPGENGAPTVTRIRKVVGSETVSFDWVHTTDTGGTFTFTATQADSSGEDTLRAPTGRFTGMHAFYLRAVDAEGAVSEPDRAAFTAATLAPVSRLTQPALSSDETIFYGGGGVQIRWTGEDPDGEVPPAAYLVRLVPVSSAELSTVPKSVFFEGSDDEWVRVASEEFRKVIADTPAPFVFAVRAVDAAGAVEPFLDWGRNAFRLTVYGTLASASPHLTIRESHFEGATFPDVYPDAEMTVLTGTPLRFAWQAVPGTISDIYGYSWGVDIVDPEDAHAWSVWGLNVTRTPDPIVFTKPGTHTFRVQVRDTLGNLTRGTIVIHVIAFTGEYDLLYVDDSFDDVYPRDSEHDTFWRARIGGYAGLDPDKVREFHCHGDNDRVFLHPREPGLAGLAHYRMLLWENRGSGFDGDSGLLRVVRDRTLAGYLGAGGKLWLGGRMTVGATVPDATGLRADLAYPKSLQPGQFAWEILKIRPERVLDDKGLTIRNNLYAVRPYPGRHPVYDRMDVDPAKQSAGLRGFGVTHADAVLEPMLDGIPGVLEPLYVYGATGPEIQDKESDYDGLLTALRWHDPDPAREQGPIQWFGFPLYFFRDDQAQETFNRSLDWFRGMESPAP